MNKITINEQAYNVGPELTDFSINKKASTNIEFFGHNPAADRMFIQFRNGTTYFYNNVPIDTMKGALACESIGKFFHAYIKGQFESEGLGKRLVEINREEQND